MSGGTPEAPVIEARELARYFPARVEGRGLRRPAWLRAVDGVTLGIGPAETVGVAGESGCGKTTLAKTLLGLYRPTSGRVMFLGRDVAGLSRPEMRAFRRAAQMVFQDPYESLTPHYRVIDTLTEPLAVHREGTPRERREKAEEMLALVGLVPPRTFLDRFPHELSGGQRQRVALARALILRPKFLAADEPVSMLDVSIRAGLLELLQRFIREWRLAGLYVSHDLSLIRQICDRTAILYLGRVVELGGTEEVLKRPRHPYTQALLSAVPSPEPSRRTARVVLSGEPADPVRLPPGCRFAPRCPRAAGICLEAAPPAREAAPGHSVECHLA
ncbi:MAG: ABC transporter ATP-binding protein [Acetobacteraceae bacterium]|nr:ABC transporter ATP-binding protein [Acetobacteraceae bacterium]